MLGKRSIDGDRVIHSWQPSAINGPLAKFNFFFFKVVDVLHSRNLFLIEKRARY
jgi:hypothetical protein